MPHNQIKAKITSAGVCRSRGYEVNRAGFIPCGNEKTPSLKIYDDGGWQCYRCNEGGDCFDLLMHIDSMTQMEALAYCADLAGVRLDSVDEVVIVPKRDCEALRAAYAATSLDLPYTRKDFTDECLYELFKAILIGRELDCTRILRMEMKFMGNSWNRRDDPIVSEYIDWLTDQDRVEAIVRFVRDNLD